MVTEGTKEQLIQAIQRMNHSASLEFLSQFGESDLRDYLESLRNYIRPDRKQASSGAAQPQTVSVG